MERRVVVFPAPLAPSSAVTCPSAMSRSMPCSTAVDPYAALRPRTSSRALIRASFVVVAKIRADDLRMRAYVLGRAIGDLLAEVERHDAVAHAHDEVHVVLHKQHRQL